MARSATTIDVGPTMYVNPGNVEALREAMSKGATTGYFYPAVYIIEPISRCNLQCVMCPNKDMTPANWGAIEIGKFSDLLDAVSPYCEFLMLYWMGEPLLHPELARLLSLARKKTRGTIALSTNMTNLSVPLADALLGNVDIVLCCIDRWEKTAFERVRRGASFDAVVQNTELLLDRKGTNRNCTVIVKALDLKSSSDEYLRFQRYWSARGAIPLLAWLNDWAGALPSVRKAARLEIPHDAGERTACADLWFKMAINWRGDVQMCCFDWNYTYRIGSPSHAETIEKIWHSPSIISLRSAHTSGKTDINPLCAGCTTWGEPAELEAYLDPAEHGYFRIF